MPKPFTIILSPILFASCSPIDPIADDVLVPSFAERTVSFGFQIGISVILPTRNWRAKAPQFLVGRVTDGFQQLQINRVFGLQVDAPPGGEHLLNNNNEFGSNPLSTRMVVYVYDRPSNLTFEAFTDSVRGVANSAVDERINGHSAKTIVYKGTQGPQRPRNASEALLPRHILESERFFYFIIYLDDDADILRYILRVLDTFILLQPSSG